MKKIVSLILALSLAGCGGDGGTGPSATYDSIAGTYAGSINSLAQGVRFNGTVSLTLTQSKGSLGGSWAVNGVLSDLFEAVQISGTGPITGSVGEGTNPNVTIRLQYPGCPSLSTTFTGVRDSGARRVIVSGVANFYDTETCQVFHAHPMQITIQQ